MKGIQIGGLSMRYLAFIDCGFVSRKPSQSGGKLP